MRERGSGGERGVGGGVGHGERTIRVPRGAVRAGTLRASSGARRYALSVKWIAACEPSQ